MRILFQLGFAFCIFVFLMVAHTEAASRKKVLTRDQLTSAQRTEIMERARKLCKQKGSPSSTVYRLEILKTSWRVWCTYN